MTISKADARNFYLHYQGLSDDQRMGEQGILDYVARVGCIQYDPLNVVGRNADLVLQARIADYRPEMLEHLLYRDRLLVDGWDKMMSIYRREDWPFFRFVRERSGRDAIHTLRYRKSLEALEHLDEVMALLREKGPMLPRQLDLGSVGDSANRWGHRNLASAAMDYLFHTGKLGVERKMGVNKVYAPIETLLPEELVNKPNPFETEEAFVRWYVLRRLGSVGMIWARDGGAWLGQYLCDRELRRGVLDQLVSDGEIIPVEVEDIPEPLYVRREDMPLFDLPPVSGENVRVLAPLDNLLWDRGLIAKVFDFEYTWEVYVPASKRKYGYYVLPVLCGDRLIARFEPEKAADCLRMKNWWWEPDVRDAAKLMEPVLRELERFAVRMGKREGVDGGVRTVMERSAFSSVSN